MSRQPFFSLLLGLVPLVGADAQPRAQSPWVARYAREVDSLGALASATQARLLAFDDSVGRLRRALDSVEVPPFQMLVERELRPMAVAAARMSGAQLQQHVGTLASAVSRRRLVVRTERARDREDGPDPLVIAFLDSTGREVSQLWGHADTTTLARWMTQSGMQAVNLEMPPELGEWLRVSLSFDTLTASSWSFLRVTLASSEATIARRCFDGDMRSCRIALGVDTVADRAREWYDAHDRRLLASRQEWILRRADEAATTRCLEGDDESCIAAINKTELVRMPASSAARATLAQLAVQIGGPGAGERLFTTQGMASQRLESASGMPIDALIGEWHRRMRSARLGSADISARIVGSSLAWLLVFGALSLRSSRWR